MPTTGSAGPRGGAPPPPAGPAKRGRGGRRRPSRRCARQRGGGGQLLVVGRGLGGGDHVGDGRLMVREGADRGQAEADQQDGEKRAESQLDPPHWSPPFSPS